MSRRHPAALLAAALLLVAQGAGASTRPGLDIKVTGVTGPARPGVPITAQVQFLAHEPLTLKQFAFGMRGVTVGNDAPPDSVVLPAGGMQTVNINVVPGSNSDFTIEVVANGVKIVRMRDWSQQYFDLLHYGAHVGFDPQPEPPITAPAAFVSQKLAEPRPLPVGTRSIEGDPVMTLEQARRQAGAMSVNANETHHLHGALRFLRPDGSYDRVDGATYTIWLDAPGVDIPVASGISDGVGRYDETVVIPSVLGRSFYMVFVTDNGWVHVLNNTDDDDPFKLVTSHWNGVAGGGDKQQSFLVSNDASARPCHILTTVTRAFRYVLDHTSYTYPDDIDDVDVAYPDSDWPHYAWPLTETINVPAGDWAWDGGMLIHEFGHHVNYELPLKMLQEDTEDGNCENEGDPGRHCAWCKEDDLNVAVGEGFGDFFEAIAGKEIADLYGAEVLNLDTWEDLPNECNNGNSPCGGCSPYETEGFFAALLVDLTDDTPGESDGNADDTVYDLQPSHSQPEDKLSLGFAAVLDIFVDTDISTVQDFKSAFFSRYGGSLSKESMWNNWANAGYWLDFDDPLPPSNIHSTDHTPNSPSADGTISLAWDVPADASSGIQEYAIRYFKNGVGSTVVFTPNPAYTTADLTPGTYRFEISSTDLQGNHSYGSYPTVSSPDYIVRDPYPTDLNERLLAGWTDGVVARCIAGATTGNCTDTPTLAGNQDSTWFAWAVENTGEVPVDQSFRTRLLVDGEPLDSVSTITIISPPNSQTVINRGPHTIRGGRHTVEAWTDAGEVIPEQFETNNRWGRQFVWKPLQLSRNTGITRSAPPNRLGGSNVISVPIGGTRFYNCDGLAYTHTNSFPLIGSVRWVAAELWAEHPGGRSTGANYDLMLHYPTDGSNDGFTDGLVSSVRGDNLTDAIITNNVNASQSLWNIGVVNTGGDATDYHVRINTAGTSGVGDSIAIAFADGQMVAIRNFDVASGETGKMTVEVRRLLGSGTFKVSWISSTASFRTLSTVDGTATMNASGFGSLSFTASIVGQYALVIWRDPSAGTAPATVSLKAYRKPADLAIVTPSGWAAPLVPRPTSDGTSSLALAPAILYGDDKPTWINASKRNASDVTSGLNIMQMRLDDQVLTSLGYNGLLGLTTYTHPNVTAPQLPGGRHVLSLLLDPSGLVPELDELNNTYGAQWSWLPDTMTANTSQWRRGQIGGPLAGWEYCLPEEYVYFDCDGVRMPSFAPGSGVDFAAIAVTPRDTTDVDAALFAPTNSSDAGFETPLEESYWGKGETELLLCNYTLAARTAYDVGITRVSDDTTSYVVDLVSGVVRNAALPVHGPFTLAASRTVQVHQFALPVGRHVFHLRNMGGTVDWAMALYDAERPFQNRSQGEERGWSWENGAGQDEEIVFVAAQPAVIALVVYKTSSSEIAKSGSYQIELNTNPTGVEDGGPVAATRLSSAFPNPFGSQASVHFELAREGDVAIEVYDLRGARVRTLLRGRHEAGRHSVAWDGRDESGGRAAAGVYLVRMTAGSYSGQQKLVRVE